MASISDANGLLLQTYVLTFYHTQVSAALENYVTMEAMLLKHQKAKKKHMNVSTPCGGPSVPTPPPTKKAKI